MHRTKTPPGREGRPTPSAPSKDATAASGPRSLPDHDLSHVQPHRDPVPGPGNALDRATRSAMERSFGDDFADVRIHVDTAAEVAARTFGARAYTVGSHIVFGKGTYDPQSGDGRRTLAHELTHVVQQRTGAVDDHGRSGGLSIGGARDPSEHVARAAGSRVAAGLPAAVHHGGVGAGPAASTRTMQRDGLPVERFSPALGLLIDRNGSTIRIFGTMEVSGPEATAARAAQIQQSINQMWTVAFPDGSSVVTQVVVRYRAPGTPAADVTQITIQQMAGPSNVSGGAMTLNASSANVYTWVAPHEFGHVIGLADRYSEGLISKIMGRFGGDRTTAVDPGYESNIMARHGGTLESRNLTDLAAENAVSSYGFDDDDRVRSWVGSHSAAEIARLPLADKLTAIRTLMGGWVSDDDIVAIVAIVRSARSPAEGTAIRAIDWTELTSIGQRTQVRVAMTRMP
ncbi:DUF4157 domain-containing protein [Isoptericola sp. 178]|uniref:eCIS core domain-containing protein n=1 Tax=Isoptericola sp. 178 TaxID=3064651 RepID=UPI0027134DE2|nr:DUF4157 domain-containing protein [Isoptericola sp. 178]MDO8144908.1 DUF4157 domain-containing protein [Isoptericola sp. 178]